MAKKNVKGNLDIEIAVTPTKYHARRKQSPAGVIRGPRMNEPGETINEFSMSEEKQVGEKGKAKEKKIAERVMTGKKGCAGERGLIT